MQTEQRWFLDFIEQPNTQFNIPSYQRVYSWLESQSEELWNDVVRSGEDEVSHYMSTTLFLDAGTTESGARKLDIIDGQQRIATMTIVLTALRDYLRETGTVLANGALANQSAPDDAAPLDADAIQRRFLTVRSGGKTEAKIKLIGLDGSTLSSLVLRGEMPERSSRRVRENYEYYSRRMREDGFDPQVFWAGLRELLIISAELDEHDKAQKIFEGLNTKGIPLTAADLIRNYLLVGKTREEQQRLYLEYWQPMEIMFVDDQNSSSSLKLNTGLRMWLAIRFRGMCIADRERTYQYFKIYMQNEYDGTVEELLDEMRGFCFLWSKNYEVNGGRIHCSKFAWAKKGKQTLVPTMSRSSDIRGQLREERLKNADEPEFVEDETLEDVPYERMFLGSWGVNRISWRVLERSEDSALLISEKILDCLPYHSNYAPTTWEQCSVRAWANRVFAKKAFSDEERERLLVNAVHTPGDELWDTVGGPDCEDLVYLLSFDEALRYFEDSDDRMAKPTAFAVRQGVGLENGHCLWWLRSPGHGQAFAATVWPVGGVDTAGSGVGRAGVGFRPVIRVRL